MTKKWKQKIVILPITLDGQSRRGAEHTLLAQQLNRQLLAVVQREPTLPPVPGIREVVPFKHFVFESPITPE